MVIGVFKCIGGDGKKDQQPGYHGELRYIIGIITSVFYAGEEIAG